MEESVLNATFEKARNYVSKRNCRTGLGILTGIGKSIRMNGHLVDIMFHLNLGRKNENTIH